MQGQIEGGGPTACRLQGSYTIDCGVIMAGAAIPVCILNIFASAL